MARYPRRPSGRNHNAYTVSDLGLPPVVPVEPFRGQSKRHNFVPGSPLFEQAEQLSRERGWGYVRISESLGVPYVIAKAHFDQRHKRQVSLRLEPQYWDSLVRAARARRLRITTLVRTLIEDIAEEDMFDAILDDGVQT